MEGRSTSEDGETNRNTYTDIDLEMVISVLTQISDTTYISEVEDLPSRRFINKDDTMSEEFWWNPEASVKEDSKGTWQSNCWYDWGRVLLKTMKLPVINADQNQKHQSKKIAKNDDNKTVDISELEDLSKKKIPPVRNVDKIQKNQIKGVANNGESHTADAMSELEDLPKNSKMSPTRKMVCYSGTEEHDEPYR